MTQVEKVTNPNATEEIEKARLELEQKENAEILAVCKKHNVETVYKVSVPLNDSYTDIATCFLKYPTFEAYSIALTLQDKHPLKGKKLVLDSMWLEGDERLKDNTKPENLPLFYSLCTVIDEVLDIKAALLKKKSMSSLLETASATK